MAQLTVTISKDAMLACISGTVQEEAAKEEITAQIHESLAAHSVCFGIQEKLVLPIAEELYEKKRIDEAIAAIGEFPRAGKMGGARFAGRTYNERLLDKSIVADMRRPVYYHELRDHIADPCLVREGEKAGEFRDALQEVRGHTVLGEALKAESPAEPFRELGQGLSAHDGSRDITCTMTGIVIRRKDQYFVLPVNLDGNVRVTVGEDRLRAFLNLYPPGPGGRTPAREDIVNAVNREGIVYGVNDGAIDESLALMAKTGMRVENFPFAEGTPPQPGRDASVEYRVNLSFTHAPHLREDGSADYYRVHLFENVTQGAPVATITPATDGVAGTDVYGSVVEAPPGKEAAVAPGKNIERLADDPATLVAAKTGHIYLRKEKLVVEEVQHIEGDVDFGTGNIDFSGDVVIGGDIKSGFTVNAAGSVSVGGTVEDGFIDAGESVLVRGGFIGKGKGKIKAGDTVIVKHVRNQTVMARNNILIEGEAVDAHLFAGNEIFIDGRSAKILGGTAVARNRVNANTLGNTSQVATEVASGVDLFVKKILEELERDISDLEKELTIIADNEKRLSTNPRAGGEVASTRCTAGEQLTKLRQEHEKKIQQLRTYRSRYCKSLYDDKGTVSVRDTVYPGVMVKIGSKQCLVRDALQKCLFYSDGDMIRSRALPSSGGGSSRTGLAPKVDVQTGSNTGNYF